MVILSFGAHPRSRGENVDRPREDSRLGGSSPLTRGKLQAIVPIIASVRLIPAHAGKTTVYCQDYPARTAHPRSRGENRYLHVLDNAEYGSSPLTRGKHDLRDRLTPEDRLIPAHAGKTEQGTGNREEHPAHPRSRGENSARGDKIAGAFGSSPLTRGKRAG